MVSAAIVVSADIVEAVSVEAVESVTVVEVSVDSVLELEQEVARAIIDSRKNAYLAMFFRELDELSHLSLIQIMAISNPSFSIFFRIPS